MTVDLPDEVSKTLIDFLLFAGSEQTITAYAQSLVAKGVEIPEAARKASLIIEARIRLTLEL
jgi:hypothetical protein